MTTIHLVRHGETIWHKDARYAGSTDVALTPLGEQQARDLVEWALTAGIDKIVCSDLQRAQLTAAPSASALGITPLVDPRWRELDFGRAEGLSHEELAEEHAGEWAEFAAHPGHSPLMGGEAGDHGVERAAEALAEIVAENPEATVLIVAHSTLGRLLLCHLLGIPLDAYRVVFPFMLNGAVTTFTIDSPQFAGAGRLLGFNVPAVRKA